MTLEEIEEIRNFINKYEHKCEFCGKEFRSPTKRRRFCSDICWKKYRSQTGEPKEKREPRKIRKPRENLIPIKKCRYCGNEFITTYNQRIYCCEDCRNQAAKEQRETIHTKKCKYCGKEFTTTYNQRIYCSTFCRNEMINERRRLTRKDSQPSISGNPLEGYQLQKCEKCGKTFYSKNPRRFCSQLCKINYKNAILNTAHFQKLYNELKDIDYLIRW